MRVKLFGLSIFLMLVLFGFENAKACSCYVSPYVNQRFENAQNIFIGTVEEATKTSERGVEKFKIKVIENLKGGVPQEIFTYYDNADVCPGFYFRKGNTYLIFGNQKENNLFRSSACGGTEVLENSKKELSFVRDLAAKRKVSAMFGNIKKFDYEDYKKHSSLGNIKVILTNQNDTKFETLTDNSGDYFFPKLLLGKYKIEFDFPDGLWKQENLFVEIDKLPFVYEFDYFAYADGRISGRLLNSDGTPRKNNVVFIKNIDRNLYLPLSEATTDENGKFVFYGLPNSNFILYDYLPETFSHYNESSSKIYYLGNTFDLKEAKVISIDKGQYVENIEFKLLPEPPQIKGTIIDESGKVIEEADLFLQYSNSSMLWEKRIHDWKGAFSFPIFDDYKYKIYAKIMYGKFEGLESEKIEISKADIGKAIKLVIKTKN